MMSLPKTGRNLQMRGYSLLISPNLYYRVGLATRKAQDDRSLLLTKLLPILFTLKKKNRQINKTEKHFDRFWLLHITHSD